jgi:hypothetical protein
MRGSLRGKKVPIPDGRYRPAKTPSRARPTWRPATEVDHDATSMLAPTAIADSLIVRR